MQIGEMNGRALVVGIDRDKGLVTPIHRTWPERFAWGYIREMEHFVDCIRHGAEAGGRAEGRPLGRRRRARRHEVVPGGAAGAPRRGHELMRAAVYHGPGDLRIEERERPEVGAGRGAAPRQPLRHLRHRSPDRCRKASPRPAGRRCESSATKSSARSSRSAATCATHLPPRAGHRRAEHRLRSLPRMPVGEQQPLHRGAGARHHARRRLRGIHEDPRCRDRAGQRHSARRRHRSSRRRADRAPRLRASRAASTSTSRPTTRCSSSAPGRSASCTSCWRNEGGGEHRHRGPLAGAPGARRNGSAPIARSIFVKRS